MKGLLDGPTFVCYVILTPATAKDLISLQPGAEDAATLKAAAVFRAAQRGLYHMVRLGAEVESIHPLLCAL